VALPPDRPALVPAHILVAEDDLVVQLVVRQILTKGGHTVDLVTDGQEAVRAVESRHYDLVLMDCLMPRMDGFEATRRIRKAGSRRMQSKIPILAMTSLTDRKDRLLCLEAGMDVIVNKPLDPQSLLGVIQRFLGRAKSDMAQESCDEETETPFWEEDLFESVIEEFQLEVPRVINDLQEALDEGNAARLRHLSHRLRGATDILNASRLSSMSQSLERAAKDGEMKVATHLVSSLIEELQKLTSLISE
jgi:two-component system sensor histidine kinase/response regulator